MAEAAVLATLGWVASPAIKLLIDKALDHLNTDINDKRVVLESIVIPQLSQAIEKAEARTVNGEKFKYWLQRLKDAYYEAEDAIDLFEYELLERKARRDDRLITVTEKVVHKSLSVFSLTKSTLNLKYRVGKLIEIAKEANQFHDLLKQGEIGGNNDHDRDTGSEPPIRVFGREQDRDKIFGLLVKEPLNSEPGPSIRRPIPIIAIIGRSGIGKTALAQYVYKFIVEEKNHFDLTVWVHVPRIFKAHDVIKDIIHNIQAKEGSFHVGNYDSSISLSALETQIQNMLCSKKFLLFLDDFWCDSENFREQWDTFIKCLGNCSPESRILLTTQSDNTPKKADLPDLVQVLKPYYLKDLKEGEFFDLFMHHARPSDCCMQSHESDQFEKIGSKIAGKLKGDPSSAKVVGYHLRHKPDIRGWEEISEQDWLGDDMKARIWSYQQLPAHLQRCFAFCSLTPRGNLTSAPCLIKIWMAAGFIIKRDNDNYQERMEDIGEKYMRELVSRFFIEQHAERDEIYLHDLFYDLAERVRGDDYITIHYTNSKRNPLNNREIGNIRHVSLPASMITELKNKLTIMKNLRTLAVIDPNGIIPKKSLEEILKNSRKLRVLYLPMCVDDLPDSIGNLMHLRYLNLFGSQPLKKLPGSICKLYHLQTLFLPRCEILPKNFCELISLRHFSTGMETNAIPLIYDVGRLTCLQSLGRFVVMNKPGHEIHQLNNLNQLRQKLCIESLENVVSIESAIEAKMKAKRHLVDLNLEWKSDASNEFQLLNVLQPHPNISRLRIAMYGGDRFPSWLEPQNPLHNITSLELVYCTKVEMIPSLDKSIPNCESLTLEWLSKLKQMPALPSNLAYLVLVGMPQLSFSICENHQLVKESILVALNQTVVRLKSNCQKMPERIKLDVTEFLQYVKEVCSLNIQEENNSLDLDLDLEPYDNYSWDELLDAWVKGMCCHLNTMFMNVNEITNLALPSSLTYLWIGSCSITDDALCTCLQSLISLSQLKLSQIQTITSLPEKHKLSKLKNLRTITIEGCYLLSSLGSIGALTSLKELKLERCLNLNNNNASNEEPYLPSFLEKLEFQMCVNVDAILEKSHLPILRDLTLQTLTSDKIGVVLNVGHLSSLETLTVLDCSGHLKGLSSLASLRGLVAISIPNYLPSPGDKYTAPLEKVGVTNPLQLKLMLSDETISSIENLSIFNVQGDDYSVNDEAIFRLLTSLRHLRLRNCDITHLLAYMKNLASLQYIYLEDCTGDLNLTELEDLTQNLRQLEIMNCPTLMNKLNKYCGRPYQLRFQNGSAVFTFLTEEERNVLSSLHL